MHPVYFPLSRVSFWSDRKKVSGNDAILFDDYSHLHATRKIGINTNNKRGWTVKEDYQLKIYSQGEAIFFFGAFDENVRFLGFSHCVKLYAYVGANTWMIKRIIKRGRWLQKKIYKIEWRGPALHLTFFSRLTLTLKREFCVIQF